MPKVMRCRVIFFVSTSDFHRELKLDFFLTKIKDFIIFPTFRRDSTIDNASDKRNFTLYREYYIHFSRDGATTSVEEQSRDAHRGIV